MTADRIRNFFVIGFVLAPLAEEKLRSGLMMIFRTFDHVSYGLVLESTRVIHENDVVRTPK